MMMTTTTFELKILKRKKIKIENWMLGNVPVEEMSPKASSSECEGAGVEEQ